MIPPLCDATLCTPLYKPIAHVSIPWGPFLPFVLKFLESYCNALTIGTIEQQRKRVLLFRMIGSEREGFVAVNTTRSVWFLSCRFAVWNKVQQEVLKVIHHKTLCGGINCDSYIVPAAVWRWFVPDYKLNIILWQGTKLWVWNRNRVLFSVASSLYRPSVCTNCLG